MTLPVVEVFGPTIQGEGPAAGRNAAFLRLGGCNLSCAWCDTPYSWDPRRFDLREQIQPMEVATIGRLMPVAAIAVVTGGEPLLQQRNPSWASLLEVLRDRYSELHLETNGTIEPTEQTLQAFDLIAVSPKMEHAGPHRGRQNPQPWPGWPMVSTSIVKIVVQTADDVDDAVRWTKGCGWPAVRTWVMPEGCSKDALAPRWPVIAAAAAKQGVNASHRLHILAWNESRGH